MVFNLWGSNEKIRRRRQSKRVLCRGKMMSALQHLRGAEQACMCLWMAQEESEIGNTGVRVGAT